MRFTRRQRATRSGLRGAGELECSVSRTAGVLIVRDAVDVVPLAVAHHLAAGLEHVHVIDDGSSDGTTEFLEEVAQRSGRVTTQRLITPDNPQQEFITETANRLIREGFRLIVPFDADEFWDVSPSLLYAWVQDQRPRALTSEWRNFAQARGNTYPRSAGLFDARYRADTLADVSHHEVMGFRASFLHFGPVAKVAVWSDRPVVLDRGQHQATFAEGPDMMPAEPSGVEVMHLPLRWRSELTKRALNYEPRRARQRIDPDQSWQSLFHLHAVQEGREREVWAANSVDHAGRLDVYGEQVRLESDDRLHKALLRAAALLRSYGLPVP